MIHALALTFIAVIAPSWAGPSTGAQDDWEASVRRSDPFASRQEWIDASKKWLDVKTDKDLPPGSSACLSANWRDLNDEVVELESRRQEYMGDWSRAVQAVKDSNEDALKQNAAARAHGARGPHECPCAELASVNAWSDRVDQRVAGLREWRGRMTETVGSLDTGMESFLFEVEEFAKDVEAMKELANGARTERARLRKELEELRGRCSRSGMSIPAILGCGQPISDFLARPTAALPTAKYG